MRRGSGRSARPAVGRKITQQHHNGLAYLVHVKYADEFQHSPKQVASVRGLDYMRVYRERHSGWLRGRAHVKAKRAKLEFESLREMVLQGEVTREQIMLTDELFDVCSRHQREIEDALSAYSQRRAYRAAAKLRAGDDFSIAPYDDEETARLAAIGRTPETDPSVALVGPALCVFFQEPERSMDHQGKLHLDIVGGPRETEVTRLVALGAEVVKVHARYTKMRDPEGTEFCSRLRRGRSGGGRLHGCASGPWVVGTSGGKGWTGHGDARR